MEAALDILALSWLPGYLKMCVCDPLTRSSQALCVLAVSSCLRTVRVGAVVLIRACV